MLLARRSPHRTTYSGLCSAISSAAFWYACVRAGQTPPIPLELILPRTGNPPVRPSARISIRPPAACSAVRPDSSRAASAPGPADRRQPLLLMRRLRCTHHRCRNGSRARLAARRQGDRGGRDQHPGRRADQPSEIGRAVWCGQHAQRPYCETAQSGVPFGMASAREVRASERSASGFGLHASGGARRITGRN
jgi:hypothetical protein